MYIVKSLPEGFVEIYFSNNEGNELMHVINRTEIISLITSSMNSFSNILVKETIADRDDLVLDAMTLVLVKNASADPTVNSGAAMYMYDAIAANYVKISEYESMDFSLDWNSLLNRPTSSVVNIDDAVSKRHQHTNHTLLDSLSKDAGNNLLIDGNVVKAYITNSEW
jgi:hypothetical protein